MSEPRVSIYCLLARNAPMGVIFRRGPSKRVLLLSWNTRKDTFRAGQWFKGRIYERRCDLSPNGTRLIYFAASYRPPHQTWTAVSRPPFLTAVALWPKGDAWGGGGLFESESSILLNHRPDELQPAEDLAPPSHVRIGAFGAHPGWGEDDPIWSVRRARDGWRCLQEGSESRASSDERLFVEFDSPVIWSKAQPPRAGSWELHSLITGIGQRGGPWYVTEHRLVDPGSGETIDLGPTDWADWCQSGDLLFSAGGRLARLTPASGARTEDARLLADFGDLSFEEVAPPKAARSWDRPLPRA